MKFSLAALPLAIVLTSCAAKPPFQPLSEVIQDIKLDHLPNADEYPEADLVAVSEVHDVQTVLERTGFVTYETEHRILRVFRNLDEHSRMTLILGLTEELVEIHARTIQPDSTIIDLQPDDFLSVKGSSGGGTLYTDNLSVSFAFPKVQKNSILEYSMTKKQNVPYFGDVWYIQNSFPTLHCQYSLTVPSFWIDAGRVGLLWKYRPYGIPKTLDKPLVRRFNGTSWTSIADPVSFVWIIKNVPPFESEPQMPPPNIHRWQVRFAPQIWNDWGEVGKWYYPKYFQSECIVDDSISHLAERITEGLPDQRSRIRALYSYVQKIRYTAVALGDGGIVPHRPQWVLTKQYGDCKDKSNLLIALLRSINIPAYPALVLTKSAGDLDPGFPQWRFNHMIVATGHDIGERWWMDPTAEQTPFGQLPSSCSDTDVLLIKRDSTGTLAHTPASTHFENRVTMESTVKLRPDGSGRFSVVLAEEGEFAALHRSMLGEKSEKEVREYLQSLFIQDYPAVEMGKCAMSDVDSLDKPLLLKGEFTVPQFQQTQADLVFVSAVPTYLTLSNETWKKEQRQYPMEFGFPFTIKKTTTIELIDTKLKPRTIPEDKVLTNEFLFFRTSVDSTTSDRLTTQEVFSVKKTLVPPERYLEARTLFQKIMQKKSEKFVFVKY